MAVRGQNRGEEEAWRRQEERKKKHGIHRSRGRRSMASTGAEKEESARDGDSTALKWDDSARSFSGDGA
jgi:hypothetical protein